jgi:hypothetical protein
MVGRCPESFSDSVTLLAASVATGTYRQFPGQDFHLQETRPLSRRTFEPVFESCGDRLDMIVRIAVDAQSVAGTEPSADA